MSDIEIDEDGTMYLDEDDELYGYGILNVQRNTFVAPLGGGPMGADADLFNEEEEALEYFEELHSELDSVGHLRIVRVHLDNEADHEAVKRVE